MTVALLARLRPMRRVPALLSETWQKLPEPLPPATLLLLIFLAGLLTWKLRSRHSKTPRLPLSPVLPPQTPTTLSGLKPWNDRSESTTMFSGPTSDESLPNGTSRTPFPLPDMAPTFSDVAAHTLIIGGEIILPSSFGVPEYTDAGRDAALQDHDVRLRTVEAILAHRFARGLDDG